jgi:hypothetical protein
MNEPPSAQLIIRSMIAVFQRNTAYLEHQRRRITSGTAARSAATRFRATPGDVVHADVGVLAGRNEASSSVRVATGHQICPMNGSI